MTLCDSAPVTPAHVTALIRSVDDVLAWAKDHGPVGQDWLTFERLADAIEPFRIAYRADVAPRPGGAA